MEIVHPGEQRYCKRASSCLISHPSTSQLAITCSKLTIETLKQVVKYVYKNDEIGIALVSLLLTLNIYQTLF